jgi:hypothetical protein
VLVAGAERMLLCYSGLVGEVEACVRNLVLLGLGEKQLAVAIESTSGVKKMHSISLRSALWKSGKPLTSTTNSFLFHN